MTSFRVKDIVDFLSKGDRRVSRILDSVSGSSGLMFLTDKWFYLSLQECGGVRREVEEALEEIKRGREKIKHLR